ncbi:MAG: hypothetical protein NVS4B7_15460 [Ktedonobacteraceae bacterium]
MRMRSKDSASENKDETTITVSKPKGKPAWRKPTPAKSSHIVTAESVQAEEVPTIPLGSLQTISTLEPEVAVHSVAATRSVRLPAPLVVQPSEYHRGLGDWLQVWWEGMRPAYVSLTIMPVLVGGLLAWMQSLSSKTPMGQFHWLNFLGVLLAVVAMQVGANLVNDYYDYMRGIDIGNPLGPGGLIQQGLIRPSRVLNIGLLFLVGGALVGAMAAFLGGFYIYVFGVVGLLCAFFYSATPRSLSSLALGELVSFCIYGPLLTLGAYIVQASGFTSRAMILTVLLYSFPLGLLATAVVHVNNMRDVESDTQAKKKTLASLLGIRLSRVLFVFLVLGAYVVVVALALPRGAPHLVLITLWTLPMLVVALTGVMRADMPASLHLAMQETIKLRAYFSLLLIAALLITTLLTFLPHLPAHILPI